ncbi:protein CYP656A1 [Aspergillus nidulans FGSC A4]|uniref:Cytochrome P450, putative (Eurofung) n=1 Tax=Emericella nidulans (strain FGSC A4 / ATCC 38163 / CBS 112.46 / NRRL 194 / M139) TaxID=227321 RepID=C8V169_EMENI|nr:protein CYP656A1 [Aspergillus nidulans FGSC A4]CBF69707.1 TPA: cytochrome P450, putative (Eurofung) [Aspergillus nidulans FGSC A4]
MSAVLLGKRYVSTPDPENIKAVLATKFVDFDLGERNAAFRPLLETGVFTQDGREWERSRALLRPIFNRAQALPDLLLIEEHVQSRLYRIPRGYDIVNLQQLVRDLTLDSAFIHFLAGRPRSQEAGEETSTLNRSVTHSTRPGLISRSPAHENRGKLGRGCGNESESEGWYDLLSKVADTVSDGVQIRSQLLHVLLAARDTTARLLSSVFYMLARHPSVWRKLEREVLVEFGLATQGDGKCPLPTYTQLREMKYVRAVLNEGCTRPTFSPPPPPSSPYEHPVRNTTHIPPARRRRRRMPAYIRGQEGDRALFYRTMQRFTEIYGDDAEQFRPERWVPLRRGWGFLPFSGGPRICLGQQKALTEAVYVVVRMVQTFCDIEARDERPWREQMGLVLSSYYGVKVGLKSRNGGS